jgi:hypothetical protein
MTTTISSKVSSDLAERLTQAREDLWETLGSPTAVTLCQAWGVDLTRAIQERSPAGLATSCVAGLEDPRMPAGLALARSLGASGLRYAYDDADAQVALRQVGMALNHLVAAIAAHDATAAAATLDADASREQAIDAFLAEEDA